jgi:biotin synthase
MARRELDPFEFVRSIAVARILMPAVDGAPVRRPRIDERRIAGAVLPAGANSIFYGEKLLTTGNPDTERDRALFARLGLRPMPVEHESGTVHAAVCAPVERAA